MPSRIFARSVRFRVLGWTCFGMDGSTFDHVHMRLEKVRESGHTSGRANTFWRRQQVIVLIGNSWQLPCSCRTFVSESICPSFRLLAVHSASSFSIFEARMQRSISFESANVLNNKIVDHQITPCCTSKSRFGPFHKLVLRSTMTFSFDYLDHQQIIYLTRH